MITLKFKPCCYSCPCPDVEVNTSRYSVTLFSPENTDATIYCAHARVCKNYIESEGE